MKNKRIAKLTALLLAGSMLLAGCGSSGANTPKAILDSKEPVIGYMVDGNGKDVEPKIVVVFQEGTVTTYENTEYTMGDFAQMEDEDIIDCLNTEYAEKMAKKADSEIQSKESQLDSFEDAQFDIRETLEYLDSDEFPRDSISNPATQTFLESGLAYIVYELACMVGDQNGSYPSNFEQAISLVLASEIVEELRINAEETGLSDDDMIAACKELDSLAADKVAEANAEQEKEKEAIKKEIEELKEAKSGNVTADSSKAFICMFSDATGNAVAKEGIVWDEYAALLDVNSSYLENPATIYESQYYGYNVTDGENFICWLWFRDDSGKGMKMGFDELDEKDTYLDLDESELEEMQDALGETK